MESRRVILLRDGFLRGWLDFNYKTPLSKLREEYLLLELEREKLIYINNLRATMDASIASGLTHSPEPIKIANETYDHILGLTLPYMVKKDNINKADKESLQDPKFWKKLIDLRKKQAESKNKPSK